MSCSAAFLHKVRIFHHFCELWAAKVVVFSSVGGGGGNNGGGYGW
jgi:hypothetical protein